MEIKDQELVIYDYRKSDGYGVYKPDKVDKSKLSKLSPITDECVAGTVNPEAWCIAITTDSLWIIEKREPYIIQL